MHKKIDVPINREKIQPPSYTPDLSTAKPCIDWNISFSSVNKCINLEFRSHFSIEQTQINFGALRDRMKLFGKSFSGPYGRK